jgi:hypothetical protein
VEIRHETLARAGTANRFHDEQRQLGFSSGLAQSRKLYLCSTVVETKTEYLWHAQDKSRIQAQQIQQEKQLASIKTLKDLENKSEDKTNRTCKR